ncbi:hypothetical protein KM043_015916 [Ampulex compressa]|nr:hypothetical protein KM043_015916 [Ampulex compressa]
MEPKDVENIIKLEKTLAKAKRIAKYLKHREGPELKLGCNDQNEMRLIGYVDANWSEYRIDRKSNSGYLFKYCGTVSWACRKQSSVALLSTEAEYIALSDGCQELKWLSELLRDLQEDIESPREDIRGQAKQPN